MKIYFFVASLIFSSQLFAEPKDYQNILMNEPVSLLDFMVYQARKDLDKYVKKHMLKAENKMGLDNYREIFEDLKIEDDDWIHNKQRYALFTPPLRFTRADLDYNFKNGTFDIEVNFRWNWIPQMVIQQNISHKLEETKRNGVLVLNQKTTAKLCERAISDLLGFSIDAITHQGYTNTRLEKIEGKLQQNVLDDMRKKVRIHIDGSLPAGNWTYMTCDTIGHDYPSKINYSYEGNWHELEKIIKKRISKKY